MCGNVREYKYASIRTTASLGRHLGPAVRPPPHTLGQQGLGSGASGAAKAHVQHVGDGGAGVLQVYGSDGVDSEGNIPVWWARTRTALTHELPPYLQHAVLPSHINSPHTCSMPYCHLSKKPSR